MKIVLPWWQQQSAQYKTKHQKKQNKHSVQTVDKKFLKAY